MITCFFDPGESPDDLYEYDGCPDEGAGFEVVEDGVAVEVNVD